MAATWSAKHSEAQRARQQATAQSLQASLEATAQQATVDQALDDVTEAAWRSAFLDVDSLQVDTPPSPQRCALRPGEASKVQKVAAASLPSGADGPSYAAKLRQPALVDEQLAKAHAQESVGWLTKNNSALGVVSMLALTLFLLGLALTIGNRRTQAGWPMRNHLICTTTWATCRR